MTHSARAPDDRSGALDRSPAPARLELVGLTRRFGAVAAVDGLDLAVAPGRVTALLGPSGCGKSTTLAMVAGLVAPGGGRVVLDGRDLARVPAERRDVGLVFQRPLLFPHLDVAANVGFGLRARRTRRTEVADRVGAVLDRVGLGGFGGRRVGQLSGGQEQRVALARALVLRPRVLLLDEPFSALDPELRDRMRALVRDLQRESGVTTVFVTHDRAEALDVADDLAVLLAGRLAAHGPAAEVFTRPPTLAGARFLGVANELPGTVHSGVFTAGGPVRVPLPAASAVPDGPAVLTVRPERLTVARGEHPDPGSLPAVVAAARFAGTHVVLTLRTAADRTLVAHVPPDSDVAPGEPVRARFDAEAATVYPT